MSSLVDTVCMREKLSELGELAEGDVFITRRAEDLCKTLLSNLELSLKNLGSTITRFNNSAPLALGSEVVNLQVKIEDFKVSAHREVLMAALAVDHEVIRLLKEE